MTGYIHYVDRQLFNKVELTEFRNHLHLSYKQIPLKIVKSHFTKPSKYCNDKLLSKLEDEDGVATKRLKLE
eukprot:Pgem_evm1s13465